MATNEKQTKAQRQQSAREKARQMQEEQRRQEKRRSLMISWGIVGAVVVVVAIVVGVIFMNSSRTIPDAGPAPAVGNAEGGITLTSTTEIAPVDEAVGEVNSTTVEGAELTGEPVETVPGAEARPAGEPAQIIIYADANCVHCANFEAENAQQLDEWLDSGQATVEYRMLPYLDNPATSNYSSRAANAATCVAENNPEQYNSFLAQVFASYQTHQGQGLSDDELKEMASGLGADINSCVDSNTYRPYTAYTGEKARAAQVAGTPSVWVQGEDWSAAGEPFGPWAQGLIENRG